jgi:hypothetical protein
MLISVEMRLIMKSFQTPQNNLIREVSFVKVVICARQQQQKMYQMFGQY